jgi:anti-sigma B factor antagonist
LDKYAIWSGRETSRLNLNIVSRSPNQETRILSIEGEIDVYTSVQLKEHVLSAISEGVRKVVLNLSQVEYLDSTGLGVMISVLKHLRENQGNLIIVSPTTRTTRVFEITGLHKIFTIYDTEEVAAAEEGIPF